VIGRFMCDGGAAPLLHRTGGHGDEKRLVTPGMDAGSEHHIDQIDDVAGAIALHADLEMPRPPRGRMEAMLERVAIAFPRARALGVAPVRSGNKIVPRNARGDRFPSRRGMPADDRRLVHAAIIRPFGARSISGNFWS